MQLLDSGFMELIKLFYDIVNFNKSVEWYWHVTGMFGMFDIPGSHYSLVCQEILHRELCEQVCLLLPLHLTDRPPHPGTGGQNIYQVRIFS